MNGSEFSPSTRQLKMAFNSLLCWLLEIGTQQWPSSIVVEMLELPRL